MNDSDDYFLLIDKKKKTSKGVPLHATEAHGGRGDIAPKKKHMLTWTSVWFSHQCQSAMLLPWLPPGANGQVKCSVHFQFAVKPMNTAQESH
jgi:hypothetical protein